MMKMKLHIFWLLGVLLLLAACGDDDDYYYPSVKLEFVTVESGADGKIQTLIPDKGEALPVSKDRTASIIGVNTHRRVLCNYEELSEGKEMSAEIYSLQALLTLEPKPADDPAYKDGLVHDPVEVVSIWLGRNYLNMILNLKVDTGKGHVFGMVQDAFDNNIVNLTLYHNANGDGEVYNRRAYVTVPLSQYRNEADSGNPIKINFEYYTYGKDTPEKYSFEYTPNAN